MDKERAQAFMKKVVGDVGTAMSAVLVMVGDRAGLFAAMAGAGPSTAESLAGRVGMHPRYVREWLSVMTCAGYVVHDEAADAFVLPDEHALYFADPSAETYLGGLFYGLPSLARAAPDLVDDFRQGSGIPFTAFGDALPVAFEQMNRSVYEKRLVSSWLPELPGIVERLAAGGRALDIGCGTGVVPITLARAFAGAHVEGLDVDARSIELARMNAREAGVADRVVLRVAGADDVPASPGYDLITTFDVIHDLPDPLGALRAIRGALTADGTYLMVEPKVEDRLAANVGNPFARMLYAISCMHCVPQSLSQGGEGLGACWGPARARRLVEQAGFSRFEALPIRSPALAFYAVRP
ncbi:MAG: methyltransferase domain-containing protein [Burkholderiaceae bacterium]